MHILGKVGVVVTIFTIASVAEQSVYGNNNGFYNSDKVIAQNKKTIARLEAKLREQNERIDGLMSVVEGLSTTVNDLQNTPASRSTKETGTDTVLLQELGAMIDKINTDYVSKAEFQKVSNIKTTKVLKSAKIEPEKQEVDESKNTKELYSEGVRLFVKKRFDEAKKRFSITDTQGYKPAASNYYLGEIAYYTKQYEDAIFYFKKSAGLHDKASYIDTLLLHTAISLERNGDKEQARAFYENIIENYEGKKTASIAVEKLKRL